MFSERVVLAPSSDDDDVNHNGRDDDSEDDLYKGYNDFNPVLDTRTSRLDRPSTLSAVLPQNGSAHNIQEDDLFRETVNKSSYGRAGNGGAFGATVGGGGLGGKGGGVGARLATSSTAGVAFSRGTALKSRRTSRGTGAGRTGLFTGGGGGNSNSNRPLTAVRGAGYTSAQGGGGAGGAGGGGGGGGVFDPLNLASGQAGKNLNSTNSQFHLMDENTPEVKIKSLEGQINRLLEASVAAAHHRDFSTSLELAKEVVAKERSLSRLKEQSGLLEQTGPNVDLTFAAAFNLAEQYGNAGLLPEAINAYSAILKNRSFANTGRLRVNIGELLFRQRQYPKAIKYFRMALDTVASSSSNGNNGVNGSGSTGGGGNSSNSQTELRLKLMANIGLSFVRLQQFADAIASFEYIASERGGDGLDVQTAFHLVLCYYAMGDAEKMKYYFGRLLRVKVEDQFEERYGHHEVLTGGGSVFATSTGRTSSISQSSVGGGLPDRGSTPGVMEIGAGGTGRASSPVLLIRDEHDHQASLLLEAIRNDRLRQYEKAQLAHVEWCILTAAKLIAPYIERNSLLANSGPNLGIYEQSTSGNEFGLQSENGPPNGGEDSLGAGYDWCLGQLKAMASGGAVGMLAYTDHSSSNGSSSSSSGPSALNYSNLADELELYKAVKHLRLRQFEAALATLKVFEKRDKGNTSTTTSGVSSATTRTGLQPEIGGSHSAVGRSRSAVSLNGSNSAIPLPPSTPNFNHHHLGGSLTPTPGQRLTTSTTGHSRVAATAATNLSFLYLLQSELDVAGRYADEAIAADRYCIGALLNRGNVHYHQGEYGRALDYYREVVASNPNCLEAYYNIALAERKLDHLDRALEALFRLRTLTNVPVGGSKGAQNAKNSTNSNSQAPNALHQKISNTVSINLLYQIGSIYEALGNLDQATDFYTQILTMVPTDVSLLVKMADLASDASDRKQALAYLNEAYRYLPSHVPTIERLAAAYIEVKMYERAIKYLEQLANIQPGAIKWQLMIAASHRRAGNYQAAFSTYQTVHGRFPDNADALKFLIRLCTELDGEGRVNNGTSGSSNKSYAQLAEQYSETLKRLEKSREIREQQAAVAAQVATGGGGGGSGGGRSASRAASRVGSQYGSSGGGQRSPSREGSAATSISSGGSSSGYMTSNGGGGKNYSGGGQKSNNNSGGSLRNGVGGPQTDRSAISAIVDEVVEHLDNTTLNDRPTTSWSRGRKIYSGGGNGVSNGDPMIGGNGEENGANAVDDDDLLLDAHLDDILPD